MCTSSSTCPVYAERMRVRRGVVPALVLVVLPGCARDETQGPAADLADTMVVTSPAFRDGQPVPERFTCDGQNQSPPLAWEQVPADADALALVVDDPDAPDGTFVHWVVLDIPVDVRQVAAGEVPSGGVEALNSAGEPGYTGPCPPSGTHHYRFTVYALTARTGLGAGAELEEALTAVDEQAVARGSMVGVYERSGG